MPRIGFLHGVNGKSADGIDTELIWIRLAHNLSEAGGAGSRKWDSGVRCSTYKKDDGKLYCKNPSLACLFC
jgi:hypothetical protein